MSIMLIVFIASFFQPAWSQINTEKSNILIKISNSTYNKEVEKVRFLSVLISKDDVIIYKNDFSLFKFEEEIKPSLIMMKKMCVNGEYFSIVACNSFENLFLKSVIVENLEKSFNEISKNDEYFSHEFYNVNKLMGN